MSHRRAQKDAKKEERAMEAYKEEFDPKTAPDGEYYTCSWMQTHSPDCHPTPEGHEAQSFGVERLHDNDLQCQVVDKWDVAINFEHMKWMKANIDPANVNHNVFDLDLQIQSVIQILSEDLGIPIERLNEIYKERRLNKLIECRRDIMPIVQQQRRQALVANHIPPGLLGPNGNPLN